MAAMILETEFRLNISTDEWRRLAAAVAPAFARVPGLLWKIWTVDEARGEVQGIYLFESGEATAEFLRSPLGTQLRTGTFLRDLTIRQLSVMRDPTAVTRGPVPGASLQALAGAASGG